MFGWLKEKKHVEPKREIPPFAEIRIKHFEKEVDKATTYETIPSIAHVGYLAAYDLTEYVFWLHNALSASVFSSFDAASDKPRTYIHGHVMNGVLININPNIGAYDIFIETKPRVKPPSHASLPAPPNLSVIPESP